MSRLLETLATLAVVVAVVVLGIVARTGAKTEPHATPNAAGAEISVESPNATAMAPGAVDLVPLTPPSPVKELPGCNMYVSSVDGAVETVASMTPASSVVAIGTVTDVGPAQWNTPDGAPPASDEDYDAMHVMRLVRLDIDLAIKGSPGGPLTVWVQGGKIGCSEFITNVAPRTISEGNRFALFMDGAPPLTGMKGVLHPISIWPVTVAGIQSPGDGLLSVDGFAALAEAAASN